MPRRHDAREIIHDQASFPPPLSDEGKIQESRATAICVQLFMGLQPGRALRAAPAAVQGEDCGSRADVPALKLSDEWGLVSRFEGWICVP